MKRSSVLLAVVLTVSLPAVARASAPGSPEDVVERAFDAFNHGKIDQFVRAIHPDTLTQIRAMVLDVLDVAVKKGKQDKVLEMFQGVAGAEELKALDGSRLFAALLAKATTDPDVKQALASTRIEAEGRIVDGADKAYVVYHAKMKVAGIDMDRLHVAPLLKSGNDWRLAPVDAAGNIAMLKEGLSDEGKVPALSATKVEPLGHVMDGKRSALVVYRSVTPIGDASITRLGAFRVNSGDAAWDSVSKDDAPAVTAFLEKQLGFGRRPEAASTPAEASPRPVAVPEAPKLSPEELAARRAEGMKRLEEMKARMEKSNRSGDRPAGRGAAPAAAGALPDGLVALPSSFFGGGDRDRFYDVAPKGGVLVGVRVSFIPRFGGQKISSVRPVYRVGERLVDGKRYGTLLGKEQKAIAKSGYAVGAVNTRTGLTVDGFELVFMKVDGDRLDASDTYTSPWLGDAKGGSPRNVSSDEKVPSGLQGRSGNEVNALGLIVPE